MPEYLTVKHIFRKYFLSLGQKNKKVIVTVDITTIMCYIIVVMDMVTIKQIVLLQQANG